MERCVEMGFGICLFVVLLFAAMSNSSHATMVHGTVYDCFTLEPLDDVILAVNSTPQQQYISKSAVYSFDLSPGDYCIEARYYRGNELEYYSQENITIDGDGDFIVDVIMFPALDVAESLFEEIPDIDIDIDVDVDEGSIGHGEVMGWERYGILAPIIILLVPLSAVFFLYVRSKKSKKESETAKIQYELYELPGDLREILVTIRENSGRMTQRELRGKLHHSEAKISLMLSDLENRGIIRKFKKGRGNIIVLVGLE